MELETTEEVQEMERIRKEAAKSKQLGDTIQRFNHEPFNLVTSYGEFKVKPEKIPKWESLVPTGKAHSGSQQA